ncbi:MAG: hypothetical protein SH821_07915 [Phototrophicales bacterium]|nr:hypothetical protein [Phototrophicales bacterium]
MRIRLGAALASALTFAIGLVVILGLLLPDETLLPQTWVNLIRSVTSVLLQLTTITAALAILVGIFNLLLVHLSRLFKRERGFLYSLVLIISFFVVIITYFFAREVNTLLLENIQRTVESALAGLLFFALVYGAYRMMHQRVTWASVVFILVVLFVLVAALPFDIPALQEIRAWLMSIPVNAGARGLLLGIALATVVTGVRVLIGVDRSYRD